MSTAEVIVTGLLYVFAVLAIIILMIYLLSFAVRKTGQAKEKINALAETRKAGKAAKNAVDPVNVQNDGRPAGYPDNGSNGGAGGGKISPDENADGEDEEGETVAAIMGAISAFEEESGNEGFRVLSFRRVGRDRRTGDK